MFLTKVDTISKPINKATKNLDSALVEKITNDVTITNKQNKEADKESWPESTTNASVLLLALA